MTEAISTPQKQAEERATYRTKLIEVALPLEAINKESAREKSIRHGHPSTLHLWWARRPLAACRAVLFAQLVDDPSACPEEFPTEEAQEQERQRLFRIIEELVKWENSTNQTVLDAARREIARSLARANGLPMPETVADVQRILGEHAPPVYDPFCGGGSIPLEAQRLGLEAHASDLNPVAVLITKALIEIPPKFAGMPPVNPEARRRLVEAEWIGARGLAEDVRYYGRWMRDEAWKRIGHLYPKVKLPAEQGGDEATVIAWLWARTVQCPNPACGARMPLVRSFWLSTKKGKETWVEPVVDREAKTVRFGVRSGAGKPPEGTVKNRSVTCLVCGLVTALPYVRSEAQAGRMGRQPLAIVADGHKGRAYVAPNGEHERVARSATPPWRPEETVTAPSHDVDRLPMYGMPTWGDAFTPRQLVALTTLSDLVGVARQQVLRDAGAAGLSDDGASAWDSEATAAGYADALATYLAFGISKGTNLWSSIAGWMSDRGALRETFARQAIPMTWDYAEANPFSESGGNYSMFIDRIADVIAALPAEPPGTAKQVDASASINGLARPLVSTDPPYYDNISYADLSDFFYVWLRHSLRGTYPDLFGTLLVPKAQEMIATPYRFDGNKEMAQRFFEERLAAAFSHMRMLAGPDNPVTIYYAFKQSESDEEQDVGGAALVTSTGWETMLRGLLGAQFTVSGTWPMRTESAGRILARDTNALASSIVLACRPRPASAPVATRGEFLSALRKDLPDALRRLRQGSIAPADLPQAAIGPGMAVFSRYAKVLEASGHAMSVRPALQIINQTLAEVQAEQVSECDPDTRWAVAWFEQFGMTEGLFGDAENLFKAKNTSLDGVMRAGIATSQRGKLRLLRRDELPADWDPTTVKRFAVWELTQHLIRALDKDGEEGAAELLRKAGGALGGAARGLADWLYTVAERKGWAQEALAYNSLGTSWPEITRLAGQEPRFGQAELFGERKKE